MFGGFAVDRSPIGLWAGAATACLSAAAAAPLLGRSLSVREKQCAAHNRDDWSVASWQRPALYARFVDDPHLPARAWSPLWLRVTFSVINVTDAQGLVAG